MAGGIDAAQVRHIAKLARLNLSTEEVRVFAGQLGEILAYFKQIEGVNTDGVEPLVHALPVTDVLADDVPGATYADGEDAAEPPERRTPFSKWPAVLSRVGA
jgi:aspartyl-tRNA(Asn)/glutamyl-tRNA(Gln) amidotransferase subunit C